MFIAGQQASNATTGSHRGEKTMGLWMSIIIPNCFFLIAMLMNSICFVIMVIKSRCTFTSSLNLLMMAFLLTMIYYSLNNMVCSITGEVLDMSTASLLPQINQTGDLFSSYYSILLLFLIGLNRVSVYTSPWFMKNLFPRHRLIPVLVILAILTLVLSVFMFLQTGMERVMQTDGVYQDYVQDMTLMNISNYLSYGIALSSCVFYARVYLHLKTQRDGVVHDKTKELLNKAEVINCYQGGLILVIYSLSLILFVVASNIGPDANFAMYIHAVQEVVQSLPSLAIPLALLCFCAEMQHVLKVMLTGGRKSKHCRMSADSMKRRMTITAMSNVTSL